MYRLNSIVDLDLSFDQITLQGFWWPVQTSHNPPDQPMPLSDQASEQEYVMRASYKRDISMHLHLLKVERKEEKRKKHFLEVIGDPPVAPSKVGRECV